MSPDDTDQLLVCTRCHATIYQEHLDRGLAGMWAGQLLCPTCLKDSRDAGSGEESVPTQEGAAPAEADTVTVAGTDSISSGETPPTAVPSAPATEIPSGKPLAGARRIRTFHAKLSEGAIRHLDEQVNTWLQAHPEIEIKFASSTIGRWEGKHTEANLILTVFY